MMEVCSYANQAIQIADANVGVVVDSQQNYVWVRGDKNTRVELNLEKLPATTTAGTTDLAQIESGTGKAGGGSERLYAGTRYRYCVSHGQTGHCR